MPIGSVIGSLMGQTMRAQNASAQSAANSPAASAAASAASVGYPVTGIPIGQMGVWTGNQWNHLGSASGFPQQSSPPQVDPLVYATQTALAQPLDKKWRRFQHAMFKLDDVEGVYSEGGNTVNVRVRCASGFGHSFTLPFDCDDPVKWFAEHVLGMEFPDNNRAT